jgi:hypothetical protein
LGRVLQRHESSKRAENRAKPRGTAEDPRDSIDFIEFLGNHAQFSRNCRIRALRLLQFWEGSP